MQMQSYVVCLRANKTKQLKAPLESIKELVKTPGAGVDIPTDHPQAACDNEEASSSCAECHAANAPTKARERCALPRTQNHEQKKNEQKPATTKDYRTTWTIHNNTIQQKQAFCTTHSCGTPSAKTHSYILYTDIPKALMNPHPSHIQSLIVKLDEISSNAQKHFIDGLDLK